MRPWFIAVAIVAILFSAMKVRGDVNEEALGLGRILVSEAGWNPGADGPAILSVLRSRAERMHVPLRTAMRLYSPQVFNAHRRESRRWISDLQWEAREPRGWPVGLSWSRYKQRWFNVLVQADMLLRQPSTCDADHWAAPYFRRPMTLGWERVYCGQTKNAFWRLPADRD